ncbi:MAG: ATP-binding protein [Bacteroidales bacterium]|nr:ATP-binding protein [Bacteroidales bacterium]
MKLQISSSLDNLIEVEKEIDGLSDKLKLNSDVYANILVAVTEAVKNAIIHGNKLNQNKDVTISFESNDKHIIFTISDFGDGFDFLTIPDPTLPENIEKEEGRGIFLMNCLADEVIFNDKGNEVSLKFHFN